MFGWSPEIDVNTHEVIVARVKGVKVMTLRDPADGPSDFPSFNQIGVSFFVDASAGSDNNSGVSASSPKSSINSALAAAVSGRGDIIYIAPGSYEENVVVTKDYVTLVGAVIGDYGRPDVVPTSGIALEVKAQGFAAIHMRFAATAADSVLQRGNGFDYVDCVFDGDGTSAKAGLRLQGSATLTGQTASEGKILSSLFRGCANGIILDSAATSGSGVGSTDNLVSGCRFYSNTLDIATAKSGAGGDYSVKLIKIEKNSFEDKNKATYIDITTNEDGAAGNQSGAINSNVFASDTMSTTKVKMVGTDFTFAGNFSTVGVLDGSGLD